MEIMKAKVRKLEATVKELLKCKDKELQVIKEDQVDHHEVQENEVSVHEQHWLPANRRQNLLFNVALFVDLGRISLTMSGQCYTSKYFT